MGLLLQETVQSIKNQTFNDFEMIVVDDGSTDVETINILKEIEIPNGFVVCIDNSGLPAARNHAIKKTRAKYILPLDSDDKLHPEYLEKTIQILENDLNEELAFVTTDYRFFEEKDIRGIPKDFNPIALAVENCIPVTSLFRRKCWVEVGGYNEALKGYQDWNLWISFVARGYRWQVIREELFYYRDRKGSMLKGSDKIRGQLAAEIYDDNEIFYKKHSEDVIKEYGERLGQLWVKVRGLQSQLEAMKDMKKSTDQNWWVVLGRKLGVMKTNA